MPQSAEIRVPPPPQVGLRRYTGAHSCHRWRMEVDKWQKEYLGYAFLILVRIKMNVNKPAYVVRKL